MLYCVDLQCGVVAVEFSSEQNNVIVDRLDRKAPIVVEFCALACRARCRRSLQAVRLCSWRHFRVCVYLDWISMDWIGFECSLVEETKKRDEGRLL